MLKHVDQVSEAIGPEGITVLKFLFNESDRGKSIPVQRFRADHPEWISTIDKLEVSQLFLERDQSTEANYRIKVFALPLISSDAANNLLKGFDEVWSVLRELYKKDLSAPFSIQQISELSQSDKSWCKGLFSYMRDVHGWYSGMSLDFPYGDDSTVNLSEGVLKHKAFSDLISQVYEWNYVNASKHAPLWDVVSQRITNSNDYTGFFSPADAAGRPEWYDELDPIIKAVIDEVDRGLRAGLVSLPTMGLRTLIDITMSERGLVTGRFADRIQQFADNGWVTRKDKEVLEIVLDAGNASAHRAYFPNADDLSTCVEVVKHMLHGIYILRPKAERVKVNTPKKVSNR